MRPSLLLVALLPVLSFAQAKIEPEGTLEPRKNQKIERLNMEDDANRIEEVRVGGQSRSVTVQPKSQLPSYELAPTDLARSRPEDSHDGQMGKKQRLWNVLGF